MPEKTVTTSKDTPSPLIPIAMEKRLCEERLLAVLTINDARHAVPLAEALIEGGISTIELAWRTPASLSALEQIAKRVPEMLLGAGTLLTPEQIYAARDAGAAFGVSPGLTTSLLDAAIESGFPYAPGIMTPSDIQVATEYGCRFLKYFPAESAGGTRHLKSIDAPFRHLNLKYIVLGGLGENNVDAYMKTPGVSVIGGSWIAAPELITAEDWGAIRERAKTARELVGSGERSEHPLLISSSL